MKLRYSLLAVTLLFTFACSEDDPFFFEDDYSTVPTPFSTTGITPDTTESGLIIYEIAEGDTSSPVDVGIRDQVTVYYSGRKTNGEYFDSSYKNSRTTPVQFTVSNLVDGFTEGLIGMKEGQKRVLVIPPNLGYGGTPNALRNDTLIFDLELETIIF